MKIKKWYSQHGHCQCSAQRRLGGQQILISLWSLTHTTLVSWWTCRPPLEHLLLVPVSKTLIMLLPKAFNKSSKTNKLCMEPGFLPSSPLPPGHQRPSQFALALWLSFCQWHTPECYSHIGPIKTFHMKIHVSLLLCYLDIDRHVDLGSHLWNMALDRRSLDLWVTF